MLRFIFLAVNYDQNFSSSASYLQSEKTQDNISKNDHWFLKFACDLFAQFQNIYVIKKSENISKNYFIYEKTLRK